MPWGATWPRFGNAPPSRARSFWRVFRIGAIARRRAISPPCRAFPGACGATRDPKHATTGASSWALHRSADFPMCLVECLLDVPHTLLDLAFDLLRNALHPLIQIAGRLANSSLYLARDILDASFDLVLVHSNIRNRCMLLNLVSPAQRSGPMICNRTSGPSG